MRVLKKSLFLTLMAFLISLVSCTKEEMDIDYYPVIFEILVVNSSGENLLEPTTKGNILESEMYIELAGERFDVVYGRPNEEQEYPNITRAYRPFWFGAFIAPYWYPYSDLPERDNRLYVGEFPGDYRGEVKFKLYLDGHSYEISYNNKKINGLDVDRHFYLDGKEIDSASFTLTL